MKKFLTRFAIWIVIAFVLALLADVMITVGLRKTAVRKYVVWNDIHRGDIDADLVVLGNSQAWCSYNTYIMDSMLNLNSYNLGIDGHSLEFQLIRYETYQRFNPCPKVVLLNVCFFGTFYIMSDEQYEREQFFPYMTDATLMETVAKKKHITWVDRYVPLYRYFGYRDEVEMGMSSFFGKTGFPDGDFHKGYRGNEYDWNSSGVLLDSVMSSSIDMRLAVDLDRFAKNCCKEDVKLVFVKYPICYPVVERVENLHQSDSIIEAISKKYNIPVLDYYYSDITKDATNYYNYTHLNKKGSELFTMELCHDLDSLAIVSGLQ